MKDKYESVELDRKGALQICFCIIDSIDAYCEAHAEEFHAFLKAEEEKKRGDSTQNKSGK